MVKTVVLEVFTTDLVVEVQAVDHLLRVDRVLVLRLVLVVLVRVVLLEELEVALTVPAVMVPMDLVVEARGIRGGVPEMVVLVLSGTALTELEELEEEAVVTAPITTVWVDRMEEEAAGVSIKAL